MSSYFELSNVSPEDKNRLEHLESYAVNFQFVPISLSDNELVIGFVEEVPNETIEVMNFLFRRKVVTTQISYEEWSKKVKAMYGCGVEFKKCPRCKSDNIIKIRHELPPSNDLRNENKGEILNECGCDDSPSNPRWCCKICHFEWDWRVNDQSSGSSV